MKKFVLGILFMSVLLPLIDHLLALVAQLNELLCTKIAVKTYNLKKDIEEEPEYCTNAIGFQVASEEDYYDDDEGDE